MDPEIDVSTPGISAAAVFVHGSGADGPEPAVLARTKRIVVEVNCARLHDVTAADDRDLVRVLIWFL